MRKTILFITYLAFSLSLTAQNVSFTASAPQTVAMGRPFQVDYMVNVNASSRNFRAPEFTDFDVLGNSFRSTQQSNGQTTLVNSIFSYTLMPQKEGTFSISPASITIDNQKYTSNTLTIKVVSADKQPQSSGQSQMSKENAQQLLDAVMQDEQKTQEKAKQKELEQMKKYRAERDW